MKKCTKSNLRWMMREIPLMLFLLLLCCVFQVNAQLNNVINSYVGNTFNGGNDKWVQNQADELDVASDGTMVTGSAWDEAGRCVGIFKDGQPVALIKQYDGAGGHNCWGWGTGTEAVAVDNNYVYVNNCDGDILRFNRNSNYAYVDKVQTGIAFGMTHSGGFLYMIQANGLVQKRSVSNLGSVSLSFTVTGGNDLAVDASGNIWVLTTDKEILKYNASGANTGTKIAAQSGWKPKAVNYDAFNNLLLVSDNGPRRQVIKFNTSGTQVGTFGDVGGISSGAKGTVGDLRFWNISGCGTDAAGNIYVALSENSTSLRKFNASGVKQWEVQGTMFTDIASIDPASDGNDIYTINEHLKFNYSTQQWSMAAMTVDAIGNPTDPRNVKETGTDITSSIMRRVNGNLLMYTTGMYADEIFVYRFEGEVAVFCQSFTGTGWPVLPDKNGNIWYEDIAIKKIPLTGFNNGVPIFGAPVTVVAGPPAPIEFIERLEYDVDKDVMYIGGYTAANPSTAWGLVGSTIARFPNWSTGNRTASHSAVLPKDIGGFYPKAMSVANDYIFVTGSRDRGKTYVINSADLSSKGFIDAPIEMGITGWIDIPHGVQAFKKSNGQYVILVEDNHKGKNILYQWCPTGTCGQAPILVTGVTVSPTSASVLQGSTVTLSAVVAPSSASNKTVSWSSSNTSVATVSSSGVVTGVGAGNATITVTTQEGGKTATSAITVTAVTSGSWTIVDDAASGWTWFDFVDDPCTTCYNGTSHSANVPNAYGQFSFTGTEVEAYCETWAGGGPVNILIDGISRGSFSQNVAPYGGAQKFATITGLSNSLHTIKFVATTAIWVGVDYIRFLSGTSTNVPVTGVVMSPTTASVAVGGTTTLTATLSPSNATNKNVTWTTSASSIATVSSTGVVTGVAAGTATITVTTADGNRTATCAVTVTATTVPVTGVTMSPTTASVAVGSTTALTATVSPSNATNKNVTWTSSASSIATVTSAGLVTGVAAGSATITVTTADGNKTATCAVTVTGSGGGFVTVPGTAYRWAKNTTSTSNANRVASVGLNDNNITTNINLNNGADDVANAYEAAGLIFSTAKTITKVEFVNGTFIGGNNNGCFEADFKIQTTTDGTTWVNATGWTLSPAYAYNNTSVSGKKFTFTGSASGLLGIRVTGRVHISESTGSWEASAREITAFSGSSARNENGLMVETENLSDNSTISVYPNPANSNITVEFNRNPKNEQVQVDIIDLVGRRVYGSGILSSVPSLEINLRGYTKGNYIIQVSQGSHRVSKKLAIE